MSGYGPDALWVQAGISEEEYKQRNPELWAWYTGGADPKTLGDVQPGQPFVGTPKDAPAGPTPDAPTPKKGVYYGSGITLTPGADGYIKIAGRNSKGLDTTAWVSGDDPRLGQGYTDQWNLLDVMTIDDLVDPAKRPKPYTAPDFSEWENPFANWTMPEFKYPEMPKWELPAFPTAPQTPSSVSSAADAKTRKNKIKKQTILTGNKGVSSSTLGSVGTSGSGKGKKKLLGE
jgi:hypothetical protein